VYCYPVMSAISFPIGISGVGSGITGSYPEVVKGEKEQGFAYIFIGIPPRHHRRKHKVCPAMSAVCFVLGIRSSSGAKVRAGVGVGLRPGKPITAPHPVSPVPARESGTERSSRNGE
jgi:hypothetical protein